MLGIRAGIAVYNGKAMTPRLDWGYDTWEARQSRIAVLEAYADGTVYSSTQPFSESLKVANRLYRHIRDTHSPVKIATDLIAANVYQGTVDYRNLSVGALPFQIDNRKMETPLRQLLRASNLSQYLGRYVRDAAVKGDGCWWVVDDVDAKRIRLELIDPLWVKYKETDEAGNVKACVIEYTVEDPLDLTKYKPGALNDTLGQRETRLFTRTVDQDWYTDYLDGAQTDRWPNRIGLVPLKVGPFEPGPGEWGKSAFYSVLGKIDQINDAESIALDTLRRTLEPILVAKNITAQTKVEPVTDERTGIITLYIQSAPGVEAEIVPLTIPIDFSAGDAAIKRLEEALIRDLPILQLSNMRQNGERVTGPGVRAALSDAIGMIEMARRNLDPPLIGALQIGITMGGAAGYPGYEGFNLRSYDAGDMELTLKERQVIADQLTKQELLDKLMLLKDQPPGLRQVMVKIMGLSQTDQDLILNDAALDAETQALLDEVMTANGYSGTNPAARLTGATVPALPGGLDTART